MSNGKTNTVGMGAMVIITGFAIGLVGVYMTKDGTTIASLMYMGTGSLVMASPAFFDWVIKFFNR